MLDLQKLGERLVQFAPDLLEKMDLPPDLKEAVLFARGLKKRGARKRQLQYIGTLMRRIDPEPVRTVLQEYDRGQRHDAWLFKQSEQWRDRLVSGDDELLEKLLDGIPPEERQTFRQLVRTSRKEKEEGRPPKAGRALFRVLRTYSEKLEASED